MTSIPYETIAAKLASERIILVGGAGFIGHNLALELRAQDVEVMVVDNMMVNSLVANQFEGEKEALQRQLYLNFLLDRLDLMRDAQVQLRNADARPVNQFVPGVPDTLLVLAICCWGKSTQRRHHSRRCPGQLVYEYAPQSQICVFRAPSNQLKCSYDCAAD